jgi:hypothetical protein
VCGFSVGVGGKPAVRRLCGTWPTWESRGLRLGFPFLFLGIGVANLSWLAWIRARA